MSKNWFWHKDGPPIHEPRPCHLCGVVVRRIGKHMNHKHPTGRST